MNRTAPTNHLPRAFYRRDAVTVARALLGQKLVRVLDDGTRVAGVIVETEAYLGERDKAAHTFNGKRTRRNESMWGEAGRAYVYFTYGMHYCMNVVAGGVGRPVAVLVRGLEPVTGLDAMWPRRPKAKRESDLCSGPAKLCAALGIDRTLDGADLVTGEALFIERLRQRAHPARHIATGARVGVHYAEEWATAPLRFHLRQNAHVSPAR